MTPSVAGKAVTATRDGFAPRVAPAWTTAYADLVVLDQYPRACVVMARRIRHEEEP